MNRMDTREQQGDATAEASFSTSTLIEAMGDTSRSVVQDGYRATPVNFREICSRRITIVDGDLPTVEGER